MTSEAASRENVERIFGRLEDGTVAAILATGADVGDLEVAFQYASGADDVMGELRKPLTGPAAAVVEILAEPEPDDER